jgi:hypothetical protein
MIPIKDRYCRYNYTLKYRGEEEWFQKVLLNWIELKESAFRL